MAIPPSHSYEDVYTQAAQLSAIYNSQVSPGGSDSSLPSLPSGGTRDILEELRQAKREIELLKSVQDPYRAADLALEIQVEKIRAAEATSARDSAVQRLSSAYDSIKQKAITIGKLTSEKEELERKLADMECKMQEAVAAARADERKKMEADNIRHTNKISALTAELNSMHGFKDIGDSHRSPDHGRLRSMSSLTTISPETDPAVETVSNTLANLAIGSSSLSDFTGHSTMSSRVTTPLRLTEFNPFPQLTYDRDYRVLSPSYDPIEMAKTRTSILTSLPIPADVPDDCLKPIVIPSPFTLHEFLGNATGSLKNTLAGYRVFQDHVTMWCAEREEHGYFLTPIYKCNTNPRIITAHRWTEVDPKGRMNIPTECFYNKDGKWYYAGQYIALRLEDLTTKEWDDLSSEATSAIVKDTLVGRKNTSPQNHYEISQLYSVGALKVACVGLQCVGFNANLYRAIIDQAEKSQQNGKWRLPWDDTIPEIARHHSEPYLAPHTAAPGLGF